LIAFHQVSASQCSDEFER